LFKDPQGGKLAVRQKLDGLAASTKSEICATSPLTNSIA